MFSTLPKERRQHAPVAQSETQGHNSGVTALQTEGI
jgi:hypothetical protein